MKTRSGFYVICSLLILPIYAQRQFDTNTKLITFNTEDYDVIAETFKDIDAPNFYHFGTKTIASIKAAGTSTIKSKLSNLQQRLGSTFTIEDNLLFQLGQTFDGTCNTDSYDRPVAWHLNRINQREKLDFETNSSFQYQYSSHDNGAGIDVYVLDTGIFIDHEEFDRNRAVFGFVAQDILDLDGTEHDLNGHGTHASALIGGKTYGVVKDVRLIAVKCLDRDGFGSIADILQGLEYVYNQTATSNWDNMKAVINLSLTAKGDSTAMETAIKQLYSNNVVMVAASGMG